jgi:CRP-like cAMP-binding protein
MNMETFDVLKDYLSKFLSIPPLEWLQFIRYLGIRRLGKDEVYYHQGEMFDEIGFVVSGLLYNYYTDTEGSEFVKVFLSERMPVTCYSDLIRKTPASFSCRTLEPTILITLKFENLQKLYQRHICWERMGRISAEQLFADKEVREKEFLILDAKQRYENFSLQYPHLIQRVPQYLIASYIGVSPVSLSRIKHPQNR